MRDVSKVSAVGGPVRCAVRSDETLGGLLRGGQQFPGLEVERGRVDIHHTGFEAVVEATLSRESHGQDAFSQVLLDEFGWSSRFAVGDLDNPGPQASRAV